MEDKLYFFKAKNIRVVDGDTLDVEIDMGFHTYRKEMLRLEGLNTPETRTKDLIEKAMGLAAKAYVEDAISRAEAVYIHTTKQEKYGRWLAEIWIKPADSEAYSLNADLLEKGMAVPMNY